MFSFLQRSSSDALIRPLTTDDWDELEAMIATDPVAFLYAAEHLESFGLPSPSALGAVRSHHGFMGIFKPVEETTPVANYGTQDDVTQISGIGQLLPEKLTTRISPRVLSATEVFLAPLSTLVSRENNDARAQLPGESEALLASTTASSSSYQLVGAFWLGSNCVPLVIPEEYRKQVTTVISRASKTIASIFGSADDVLALWALLEQRLSKPLSVRENQPLLYLSPDLDLSAIANQNLHREHLNVPQLMSAGARWARTSDRRSLLKASVSMFTEEVGYDPLTRDPRGYARRVDEYIRTGRSVIATNTDGVVVFKADLGLAHADTCQIQGVWLHPAYRGLGLSEPLLAQALQLIRPRFPHISLYVNDYNTRARKLYDALGMEQVGTFSTILF